MRQHENDIINIEQSIQIGTALYGVVNTSITSKRNILVHQIYGNMDAQGEMQENVIDNFAAWFDVNFPYVGSFTQWNNNYLKKEFRYDLRTGMVVPLQIIIPAGTEISYSANVRRTGNYPGGTLVTMRLSLFCEEISFD